MKQFFKSKKEIIILLVIFIIAALPRLFNLGNVPISLSDDEIRQGYSAYSFFVNQTGINGEYLPLGFKIDGFVFGPVSIYISSLFFKIFELNMFSVRLPYALCGIFSVVLSYLIGKQLFKNKAIAIISSVLMSFSVWSIQISRLAHDVDYALLFYLLGLYLFLIAKKNKMFLIVFSAIFFILGFYSYAATKVIYIPLLLAISWYKLKDLKQKQFLVFWILTIGAFLFFLFLAKTQGQAQYVGGQFFFQDINNASLNVELERRASFAPFFIEKVFHNKFTYWIGIFLNNYLNAFSSEYLFLSQETSGIYSVWGRGMLYAIELPFLLLGFCWLLLKNKKALIFITLMLLISPLPSGIGVMGKTYLTRSVFMIPWIYLVIGAGVYFLSIIIKNNKLRYLMFVVISLIYIYSVAGYFVQYYYDWSYYGAKYYSQSTKDLVNYINKEKEERKKIIIGGASQNTVLHYAFYNRINPEIIQDNFKNYNGLTKLSNVEFDNKCEIPDTVDPRLHIGDNSIYISPVFCNKKIEPDLTINKHDKTEDVWNIFINK